MSIRISTSQLINQNLSDINRNLRAMQELQIQISTGKKVNLPSDDPVASVAAIKLNDSIQSTEQHNKNINDGVGRLNAAATTLENVDELMTEIQILSSEALNATTSASLSTIAGQVDQFMNEILLNANTKFLGKYLFGGHESLTAPYSATRDANGNIIDVTRNTQGIDDQILHQVSEEFDIQINISGSAPFMPNGEDNQGDIFDTLIRLRDNLLNNNTSGVETAASELDSEFQTILNQASLAGGRLQQLTSLEGINDKFNVEKLDDLSRRIDTDLAQAISELNYQQTVYQASLQAGSRIIPPSLLDFI